MKALAILYAELSDINESIRNLPYLSNNKNHFKENKKYVQEAIKELEGIKQRILYLETIETDLIMKENRSCSNCKHYKQSSHQIYKTCFLIKTNSFNLESNVDFCCNKWEK